MHVVVSDPGDAAAGAWKVWRSVAAAERPTRVTLVEPLGGAQRATLLGAKHLRAKLARLSKL